MKKQKTRFLLAAAALAGAAGCEAGDAGYWDYVNGAPIDGVAGEASRAEPGSELGVLSSALVVSKKIAEYGDPALGNQPPECSFRVVYSGGGGGTIYTEYRVSCPGHTVNVGKAHQSDRGTCSFTTDKPNYTVNYNNCDNWRVYLETEVEETREDKLELFDVLGCVTGSAEEKAVCEAIKARVDEELAGALELTRGGAVYDFERAEDERVSGGCSPLDILHVDARAQLNEDLLLKFTARSLEEPLAVKFRVDADVSANARMRKKYGAKAPWPFNGCVATGVGQDSYTLSGDVRTQIDLLAVLQMRPEKETLADGSLRITIRPHLALEHEIDIDDVQLRASGRSVLASTYDAIYGIVKGLGRTLEGVLKGRSSEYYGDVWADAGVHFGLGVVGGFSNLPLAGDELLDLLTDLADAEGRLDERANEDADALIHRYAEEDLRRQLTQALHLDANGERTFFVKKEVLDLLKAIGGAYTIFKEGTLESEQLLPRLVCDELASEVFTSMPTTSRPTDFVNTSRGEFCRVALGHQLGDAGLWDEGGRRSEAPWTLSPGSQLDLGVMPLAGRNQPYMKRLMYKTTSTARGTCKLEMRVYKNSVSQTGLEPLIAFHGGSYRYRGFGFAGLEATIPHLTGRGYVVFAPFYRLAGTSDGPEACNGSNGAAILEDALSALDWVEDNASRFGATGPIAVFGQSAGGHLAAYLSVHHPARVDRAWLMYPPTDVAYYLATEDLSVPTPGRAALEGFLSHILPAGGITALSASHSFVRANSLPTVIDASRAAQYPPLFIIHGLEDELVPSTQAVRLCNAVSGSANLNSGSARNQSSRLRTVYPCGANGELHLLREAEHILEICLVDGVCPSGSHESAAEVNTAITRGLDWLQEPFSRSLQPPEQPIVTEYCSWTYSWSSSSSGGGGLWGPVAEGRACRASNVGERFSSGSNTYTCISTTVAPGAPAPSNFAPCR